MSSKKHLKWKRDRTERQEVERGVLKPDILHIVTVFKPQAKAGLVVVGIGGWQGLLMWAVPSDKPSRPLFLNTAPLQLQYNSYPPTFPLFVYGI